MNFDHPVKSVGEDGSPRYQDLAQSKVPEGFRGRSKVFVQLWWIVQGTIFAASPQVLYGFRNWLLRLFGAKIGQNVLVRPSARITYPWMLEIGSQVWIGDRTIIYNLAPITIGSNVAIAHDVHLCCGFHNIDSLAFEIGASPIVIEDEVWLASATFLFPGVTVGRGSVIGARSTVIASMPPGMVCYGYPCRPIRPRGSQGARKAA